MSCTSLKTERESIRDFMRRMRETNKNKRTEEMSRPEYLKDEYEKSMNCGNLIRKPTGVVYHDDMMKHKCEWDEGYPEKPERYLAIFERMEDLGLIDRCKKIPIQEFKQQEILHMHEALQLENLRRLSVNFDVVAAEKYASEFDAIYFNKDTYKCALLAVNATLSLVKAIAKDEIQNGMGIVRPPGHHAQRDNYNGYCFLNNVAIATNYLRTKEKLNKILIVDFDVHHGQGTQRMFYNDNSVLYFSIHRYENGLFWPNLREGSFDHIGGALGAGYNINVPLNTIGLGDSEYMAIVTHILLPVAYEFNPDFILVSAGYDSAIGDEKGLMKVSPGFYGHLIKLLSGLANGKMAVILEGGYFLPSLAEGAAMTMQGLLDDLPAVLPPLKPPHPEVIEIINNLKFVLHDHWKCFQNFQLHDLHGEKKDELHKVFVKYFGKEPSPPYETRNCYPLQAPDVILELNQIVNNYKIQYGSPTRMTVCYSYDSHMLLHKTNDEKLENPKRLEVVYNRFKELQLHLRCKHVKGININDEELAKKVHSHIYVNKIMSKDFVLTTKSKDLYWDQKGSKISIKKAISSLIAVVDEVLTGKSSCGVAIIRPPGHHAESNRSLGFCFMNNVAIAAQYILDHYKLERILIIDFDIHHGNGIQKIFYDTNKVLYISLHKYENGSFFPCNEEGSKTSIGKGLGEGYNINIPFNKDRMDDVDYLTGFFRCILPVAYSYSPQVVLVSAGFDAGINDLLGNYLVHPETFGHFIQLLKPLAGGKIILAMEGGYNLTTLKHSMNFCIKTLLGDPLPKLNYLVEQGVKLSAAKVYDEVIEIQKKYWPVLGVDKLLPNEMSGILLKNEVAATSPTDNV